MRTKDFIEKAVSKIEELGRYSGKCASVFSEGNCIYSYGYHYPLLFTVVLPSGDTVWVCNTHGYSSTTRKHIGWCYNLGVSVELQHNYGVKTSYDNVCSSALGMLERVRNEMQEKKRKDTNVFIHLQTKEREVEQTLNMLECAYPVSMQRRLYECVECGHREVIQTNHTLPYYPVCKGTCKQILNPHTASEVVIKTQTRYKLVAFY